MQQQLFRPQQPEQTLSPILGTSVTDYGVALDIDNFDGTVGGNISGTADLAPLDGQADMLHELFPDAQEDWSVILLSRS